MPVLEFERKISFTPEYPEIPTKKSIAYPITRTRPQARVIQQIILGSDRFYKPRRIDRREFTSTGTQIHYPNSPRDRSKKYVAHKSFLWNSDWNSRSSCSSSAADPSSPIRENLLDDLSVFEEDPIGLTDVKNLRRINTISARKLMERERAGNSIFKTCEHYGLHDDKKYPSICFNSYDNLRINKPDMYDPIVRRSDRIDEGGKYEWVNDFIKHEHAHTVKFDRKSDEATRLMFDSRGSLNWENSIFNIRRLKNQIQALTDDLPSSNDSRNFDDAEYIDIVFPRTDDQSCKPITSIPTLENLSSKTSNGKVSAPCTIL